jgi:hypothetical protein
MRFFKVFLLSTCLFCSGLAYGQLNNRTLMQTMPVKPENAKEIRFGLYAFGFSKNNEYFNKIADGYTLFGYHLNPKLIYKPAPSVRVDAGVFMWKDFGSSGYQDIAPTFSAKILKDNWSLTFGTLEGNLNHGYIEPLYDFERVINNRLENGLQYKLQSHTVDVDAWIDWANMLYRGEDDQEVVNGGARTSITLLEQVGRGTLADSVWLKLPMQFTAQHKGGQIDASDLPLLTVVNLAVGLELEKKYTRKVLHRLYTKNYLLGFKDFSNEFRLPYTEGHGVYLNIGADTKYQDVMLSYWKGKGYITELGGKLYQSASTTFKHPDYLEKDRELIIVRLMKDIEILDNLHLTLRLEPMIDLHEPKLEFSNSLYLTFDTDFFIAKPKR